MSRLEEEARGPNGVVFRLESFVPADPYSSVCLTLGQRAAGRGAGFLRRMTCGA
jgi:hypothetical protein